MGFDNLYPNRKDKRKPYRRSARFDRGCRPGGKCDWCRGNRLHGDERRKAQADGDRDA